MDFCLLSDLHWDTSSILRLGFRSTVQNDACVGLNIKWWSLPSLIVIWFKSDRISAAIFQRHTAYLTKCSSPGWFVLTCAIWGSKASSGQNQDAGSPVNWCLAHRPPRHPLCCSTSVWPSVSRGSHVKMTPACNQVPISGNGLYIKLPHTVS